jgi:hypothetical protein
MMVLMIVAYVEETTVSVQAVQTVMQLIFVQSVQFMMAAVHLFYIQEMLIVME